MTYNGLETCIINNQSYENESRTSRGDGCASDSLDDDFSSCSSSKDAFGSFSSKWMKRDEQGSDEWELSESPKHFYVKEKPAYSFQSSDVETMKENFAKLLLGEDITGGRKGVSTALALSNAITNLAIMTPKARADIHMNLPALQKLDSMLIETLESMVNAQFYYAEVGSRAEGRNKSARESKRWWLPLPQVPKTGLSDTERQKLQCKGKVVYQVFKAAASINENVLLEIPLPSIIRDALPKSSTYNLCKFECAASIFGELWKLEPLAEERKNKWRREMDWLLSPTNYMVELVPAKQNGANGRTMESGKASLGDDLYKVLTLESSSVDEMFISLNLKSENNALEVINRLEAAVFAWKGRLTEQASGKSPVRKSWSFINPISEMDKMELLVDRAEALLRQIKSAYPNLPQTFLDASKIQYGKDVGHSILEAYSRVLKNLAFSIMCRMGEILQEDSLCNPNSGVATWCFPGINVGNPRHSHSLSDVMNKVEGKYCESDTDVELYSDASINATPSTSRSRRVWCIGKEACSSIGVSP
ncbi:hypothetical protein GOBAR_AA01772 [Gossypium barbadense]|uniref:PRONE domain-containing protein n=1 Tax=Gossypium barbadense TaxID=3634 RepID=A0A2P5YTA7_GOSBA|nr:hypothetical protein GOBAR_AA01772 [Gossypium barbadense]